MNQNDTPFTLVKLNGIIHLVCPFCGRLIEPVIKEDHVLYDCCIPIFVPNETFNEAVNKPKKGEKQ